MKIVKLIGLNTSLKSNEIIIFQSNMGIKYLDLSWNGFTNAGAKVLGEALKRNSTLIELDLSSNRINLEGAVYIARGLKVNETLQYLSVSHTQIKVYTHLYNKYFMHTYICT